jgi:hypothetical protein
MRKTIASEHVTLDAIMEDPGGGEPVAVGIFNSGMTNRRSLNSMKYSQATLFYLRDNFVITLRTREPYLDTFHVKLLKSHYTEFELIQTERCIPKISCS